MHFIELYGYEFTSSEARKIWADKNIQQKDLELSVDSPAVFNLCKSIAGSYHSKTKKNYLTLRDDRVEQNG